MKIVENSSLHALALVLSSGMTVEIVMVMVMMVFFGLPILAMYSPNPVQAMSDHRKVVSV